MRLNAALQRRPISTIGFAVVFGVLLAGCAVGISTADVPPPCPVVGDVRATFDVLPGYAILGYTIGEIEAKRKAGLQAEELGATHIHWTSVTKRDLAVWVSGTAYKCD